MPRSSILEYSSRRCGGGVIVIESSIAVGRRNITSAVASIKFPEIDCVRSKHHNIAIVEGDLCSSGYRRKLY